MIEFAAPEEFLVDLQEECLGSLPAVLTALEFSTNIALIGPKGVGKSLAIAKWASDRGVPLVSVDCSEDLRRSHLIGSFVLRGNDTPFIAGPLTTAVHIANTVGECALVFEELSALSPQSQKLLNPLTDFRMKVEVPEEKCAFKLNSSAKLWVLATLNYGSYSGVHTLNEDLRSRFNFLEVPYPSEKDELGILTLKYPLVDPGFLERLTRLAALTRQGEIEYALSTRDLVSFVRILERIPIGAALPMLLAKFEDSDQEVVATWLQAIFPV